MKNKYDRLFQPGRIGKMELKNRLIMPPMEPNFGNADGSVSDQMIAYFRERAKGGVGLIILPITCVDYPGGKATSNQIAIDDDKYIPALGRLAEAIHEYDCKCCVQIHHAGRQTRPSITGGIQPVAPSPVACPFMGEAPFNVQPRELSYDEVCELVQKFINAADRAKQAGYDCVQVHGAHGYLIGQFMSPLSNRRLDRYGGDFNGRMRFPREIITGIRTQCGPDFPILFRFSADEFAPGGIDLEMGKQIARAMESAGADSMHVSAGIYASMPTLLEPMPYPEGWRAYLSEAIKKEVQVPVSAVGVIRDPETAESILAQEKADFIEIGRTLISDPDWPRKAREGNIEDIRKCISCNHCIGHRVFLNLSMTCLNNPEVGREAQWSTLIKAQTAKKVLIAGGGPAGMEAARVAALRGHTVTLYEKSPELGGQMKIASIPPFKEKIDWVTRWQIGQLNKSGVKIKTGIGLTTEGIRKEKPEVLIIATGAEALAPPIPGLGGPNTLSYRELLTGAKTAAGADIVVAGGGAKGCECALFLAKQGKNVTVVDMLDDIALDMDGISRADLMFIRLPEAGVRCLTKLRISEISPGKVMALDRGGNRVELKADSVVYALGEKSVNDLEEAALKAGVPEVYVIGDSRKPRKISDAKYEAGLIARRI